MNANRLLALYDRVAEAPDAVTRLRHFVLDLAVRGKLVAQDPEDESASELLQRIAAEKVRLMEAGSLKRRKLTGSQSQHDLGFLVPDGWVAATFYDVLIELQTGPFGSSLHQSDYELGGTPVINPASIQDGRIIPIEKMAVGGNVLQRLSTFKLRAGDIVMGRRGEMGRCAVVSKHEDGWLCGTGSLILRIPEGIYPYYLAMLIGSPYVREYLTRSSVGATMRNLNQSILLAISVAVPPATEQRRIVAKVDEHMALCDRLEEGRTARKEKFYQLTKATLARLSAPDNDIATFRSRARFAIDAFPALTTRTNQVKLFRHAILDLAMRGKLVKQDPADEPVSELLRRVEVERTGTSNTKKWKSYPLNAEAVDGNLFDLPTGWKWVPLARISDVTMGQSPPGETYNKSGDGVPLINGPVEFTPGPFGRTIVNQFTTAPKKYCEEGDFLICVRGSTGRTNVAAFRGCIGRGVAAMRSSFDDQFIRLILWNARKAIFSMGRGIVFPSISKKQLETFPIPLPPLAEQHRIAAKVDELMGLCDRLEAAFRASNIARSQLLETVLQEALYEVA